MDDNILKSEALNHHAKFEIDYNMPFLNLKKLPVQEVLAGGRTDHNYRKESLKQNLWYLKVIISMLRIYILGAYLHL